MWFAARKTLPPVVNSFLLSSSREGFAHVWSSVMGSGRHSADNPELPKVSALKRGVDQNVILSFLVPEILSLRYLFFHFIQRYLFPSPLLSKHDVCVVNGERGDMRVMNGEGGNTLVMNGE